MISSYLKELVLNNSRVIIPGFGAFLKRDKASAPLAEVLAFSPFLRFNDELLQNFVAQKKAISTKEALQQIEEMVSGILSVIDTLEPYHIPQLGYFYRDSRGGIQFAYDINEDSNVGTAPIAPVISTPTVPVPVADTAQAAEDKEIVTMAQNAADQLDRVNSSMQRWLEEAEKRRKHATAVPDQPLAQEAELVVIEEDILEQKHLTTSTDEVTDQIELVVQPVDDAEPASAEMAMVPEPVATHAIAAQQTAIPSATPVEPQAAVSAPVYSAPTPAARYADGRTRRFPWHLLALAVAIVLIVASSLTLWFWNDIEKWVDQVFYPDTEEVVAEVIETPAPTLFVPKVLAQQNGTSYLSVGEFKQFDYAQEYARLLFQRSEAIPDIIMLRNGLYAVSVSRAPHPSLLEAKLKEFKAKYPGSKIIK